MELVVTMEEQIKPFADKQFDILFNYFINSYKIKANKILYGVLIENITSIGNFINEEKYF